MWTGRGVWGRIGARKYDWRADNARNINLRIFVPFYCHLQHKLDSLVINSTGIFSKNGKDGAGRRATVEIKRLYGHGIYFSGMVVAAGTALWTQAVPGTGCD